MHCSSKFVPWRVKDLASCFSSSHLHLEEEEPELSISKPRLQTSRGSKVFDSKSSSKGSGKASTHANKMCNGGDGGELVERSMLDNKIERAAAERGHQREAAFAEEDYIVFCFREDGKIQLIDEESSSRECHEGDAVNISTVASGEMKDDEIGIDETSTKRAEDDDNDDEETKDKNNHVEQAKAKANASKMDNSDSCDSSESESSSSSSFAFPELGLEWTGSPVHMPRAEKLEDKEETCSILHCYYHRRY